MALNWIAAPQFNGYLYSLPGSFVRFHSEDMPNTNTWCATMPCLDAATWFMHGHTCKRRSHDMHRVS